jgi:hypothetical protein
MSLCANAAATVSKSFVQILITCLPARSAGLKNRVVSSLLFVPAAAHQEGQGLFSAAANVPAVPVETAAAAERELNTNLHTFLLVITSRFFIFPGSVCLLDAHKFLPNGKNRSDL